MRALLSLLLVAVAVPAAAFELPARAEAALARGRPFVEVKPDPDGASGVIHAAIDIDASRTAVWSVMTDCGLAPKLVANLKSCRIVERDPAGRWDVREEVSRKGFLPSVRTVYREAFEAPEQVTFHRVGGDLRVLEGNWRLTRRGEATRVTYEARASAPFTAPGWVARLALRSDVAGALTALRREVLARASNDG